MSFSTLLTHSGRILIAAFLSVALTACNQAPTINLKGSDISFVQGNVYNYKEVTAFDDVDGVVNVHHSGTVDTSKLGVYPVVYTATDAEGNVTTATRTITIVEPTAFITTRKIDRDNQINIGTNDFGGYNFDGNNFSIDWGDGSVNHNVTHSISHTYTSKSATASDIYTIKITGIYPQIVNKTDTDSKNFLSVEQWGNSQWSSMASAFEETSTLVFNAKDTPDLSRVTSMVNAFYRAKNFNSDISQWDVSNIINMRGAFDLSAFNQDISGWDVSQVLSMKSMFERTPFNQDISDWDVSNVITMNSMFQSAKAFNQDIGDWEVGQVTNMESMFYNAKAFNQDIGDWDVGQVTNMSSMFYYAKAFNQNIGDWDVSNVTTMYEMFGDAWYFNQDIGDWNVGNVTNMREMFKGAARFNQNISRWSISNVKIMFGMFEAAHLSVANYDALLIGFSSQKTMKSVLLDVNTLYSDEAKAAREVLVNDNGWTINDRGQL